MPRRSHAQTIAVQQLRYLAAAGLPPERLAERMMAVMEQTIGWEGFRLFGVDPDTMLINRLLAASANDGWARREWLQDVYLSEETLTYIELPWLLRQGVPAAAYQNRQERCWGMPPEALAQVPDREHRRYFRASMSPDGGVLLTTFCHATARIAVLQAYRRDPGSSFQSGEVAFMRQQRGVIGAALGEALARERAEWATRQLNIDAPSGVLILEPDGQTRFATDAGAMWLEQLLDARRQEHAPLPTALWSAVRGLRMPAEPSHSRVSVDTGHGRLLVEATPAGEDGAVALVLTPQREPARAALPAWWPLTPQQRTVAESVVLGRSNREIAATLAMSEHTVEWHLKTIYSALEVRSRTQLTRRYFDDATGVYRESG